MKVIVIVLALLTLLSADTKKKPHAVELHWEGGTQTYFVRRAKGCTPKYDEKKFTTIAATDKKTFVDQAVKAEKTYTYVVVGEKTPDKPTPPYCATIPGDDTKRKTE